MESRFPPIRAEASDRAVFTEEPVNGTIARWMTTSARGIANAVWVGAFAVDVRMTATSIRTLALLDGAHRHAADKGALGGPADHDDGQHGHRACGRQLRPEKSLGGLEPDHEQRDGSRAGRDQVQREEELVPGKD